MALSSWPISPALLLPVVRARPRRLIVTPFEDGPPGTRLRNLGNPAHLRGSLRLTGEEYQSLDLWGEDVLRSWSLPFTWRDPRDGVYKDFQFDSEPEDDTLLATAGSGWDPDRAVWTLRVSLSVLE